MSSHVSVIFKSGIFGCRSCPLFLQTDFDILIESLERKQMDYFFVHLNILKKLKPWETTVINEIIKMDFQNNSRKKVCI